MGLTDKVNFPQPAKFILNWGRKYSLWVMNFGLACCAIELIAASTSRHDFIRLGVIPVAGEELEALHHPRSHVAEACRAVRTNILFAKPDDPSRSLLITSAAPSEGKSVRHERAIGVGISRHGLRPAGRAASVNLFQRFLILRTASRKSSTSWKLR